jgi:hypothetical protein
MQKPILAASVLTILFFTSMWLTFPVLNEELLNQLRTSTNGTVFTSASIGMGFTIGFKTALSFAALPFLAWGTFALVRKWKNPEYAFRKQLVILGVISAVYFIGFLVKYILVLMQVQSLERPIISTGITNTIPLNQLYFYDFALIFSIAVCLLVLVLAKKKTDYANTL